MKDVGPSNSEEAHGNFKQLKQTQLKGQGAQIQANAEEKLSYTASKREQKMNRFSVQLTRAFSTKQEVQLAEQELEQQGVQ